MEYAGIFVMMIESICKEKEGARSVSEAQKHFVLDIFFVKAIHTMGYGGFR